MELNKFIVETGNFRGEVEASMDVTAALKTLNELLQGVSDGNYRELMVDPDFTIVNLTTGDISFISIDHIYNQNSNLN